MKLKKTFAAILALTMTVAALPSVSAEDILTVRSVLTGGAAVTNGEVAPASDFEYKVNEDRESVTITEYKGNGGDVVIPSVIEEKKVTSIGYEAFSDCTSLTSVTIPDGVTSIGWYAFEGCTSLSSVTIPDSVTSIGDSAFENCRSLTSVTIPDSVTSISDSVFSCCTSLASVTIPDSVTVIYRYAFLYCASLTSVTIPDSVTSIEVEAFSFCNSLTAINVDEKNVNYSSENGVLFNKDKTELIQYPAGKTADKYDIPDSVTSIDDSAFSHCTSLTSVKIPNSVTRIGSEAFSYCTSLTSVTIPDIVTSIGDGAFSDCTSLTSVTIPDSVTSIGYSAFERCTSLTSVKIPDSVTSIGDSAFRHCTSLTSVTIPDSVTWIDYSAFEGCTSLTSVEIPDSVTSIGNSAFSDCTSLTSVKIPDSVTSVGDRAFSYCTSLTSVEIPNSVTSIGNSAFSGCTSLTSVTIPDSVTSIEVGAFIDCTSLTAINVDEKNVNYSSKNGVLFNKDKTELIQYPAGKTADKYDIPDGVTVIYGYAFSNCTSLTSVEIPDSVTSIGDAAFYYCTSLTSVEIPGSVTSIGAWAFSDCTSLTAINVDEKNVNYSSQDGVLFNKDKTVLIHYPAGKTADKYDIPNSVTSIGYSAFEGCTSLTSVEIPGSVTSIGYSAFYNCTSLTAINVDEKNVNYSSENGVLFNKDKTELIQYPAAKTADKYDIPDSVTSIGDSAFSDCTSLTAINVDEKNVNYSSENGVLFNKDKTELIRYPAGKTADKYDIPNSVTRIGGSAFEGCTSLTSVTIPDSVTSIGGWAFVSCTSLTIYGYDNSGAQIYAAENKIPFKILGKEAEINKGTGIIIENLNLTGKTLEVKTTATTDTEITYNITLKDKNGSEVQPTGNVTVKIPLPSGWSKASVSRKEADGTLKNMQAKTENGYIIFITDHFSEYVLKQKPAVTLGDLNNDEKININDVKIALRGALNNDTLTAEQKIAADVNEDTKVNISDVKIILKAALNGGTIGE